MHSPHSARKRETTPTHCMAEGVTRLRVTATKAKTEQDSAWRDRKASCNQADERERKAENGMRQSARRSQPHRKTRRCKPRQNHRRSRSAIASLRQSIAQDKMDKRSRIQPTAKEPCMAGANKKCPHSTRKGCIQLTSARKERVAARGFGLPEFRPMGKHTAQLSTQ